MGLGGLYDGVNYYEGGERNAIFGGKETEREKVRKV